MIKLSLEMIGHCFLVLTKTLIKVHMLKMECVKFNWNYLIIEM